MQKISTCLWFDNQAEEAMNFYLSIFKNSRMKSLSRYGDAGPGPKGTVMACSFEINGHEIVMINGGPMFKLTEAVSLVVNCEDQKEIDYYWEKLLAGGGEESQCGWLKDKFGLSWQVTPTILQELANEKDQAKSDRVMTALMKMKKLDIAALKKAAEGK